MRAIPIIAPASTVRMQQVWPCVMTLRNPRWLGLAIFGAVVCGAAALAQDAVAGADLETTRSELSQARAEGRRARARAEWLEAKARRVTAQAERTAHESAAIAARIQEAEAKIAAREAEARIIERQRKDLRDQLAERQEPLIRLTAALQRLSRRPPVFAILRPGSIRDTVHMRALLDVMLPEVEQRTVALRGKIERGRALRNKAVAAAQALRDSQAELEQRRQRLVELETRQRLASREAAGIASREADRALALSEKARDLTELMTQIGEQGRLRGELAQLPGPIIRPERPERSQVIDIAPQEEGAAKLASYMLPLSGRLVAGFGAPLDGRTASRGIVLAARGGAQAVAPAAGRVAFAGPYRGYGRIVIIEHDGGWTSLVTGLAKLDARVGEELVRGSPLGVTAPGDPIVTVELRRNGVPVNPLQYVGNS